MQEKPIGNKVLDSLPASAVADVADYLIEYGDPQRLGRSPSDLGPREFFSMWQHWNGYGSAILELIEALGWVQPQASEDGEPL